MDENTSNLFEWHFKGDFIKPTFFGNFGFFPDGHTKLQRYFPFFKTKEEKQYYKQLKEFSKVNHGKKGKMKLIFEVVEELKGSD